MELARSLGPHTSLIVLTLLATGLAGAVRADEPQKTPQRTLAVVGRGELRLPPDVAMLSMGVETTARTAAEASQGNAQKSRRVVNAVKGMLGDADVVQTSGYRLDPRYGDRKPGSSSPPEIVGYIARNQVTVRVHDLDSVGRLLDAGLAAGANRAGDLNFGVEDRAPHLRRALALAGAEAKAQAESIAQALGVKLGPVLNASTSSAYEPPVRYAAMAMRAESDSTPIEAGDISVSAILNVTYGIE